MQWDVVLSSVLQAVLIVLLPPLVAAAVKWLLARAAMAMESVRISRPELAELIEKAADFAVKAAEQAGIAELIEDKKKYALEVAEKWLESYKVTVDLELLSAAIEKSVLELFNSKQAENSIGLIPKH